jgi:hypothetical protein
MILKIAITLAGMWAALRPASYGFLFIFSFDSSIIFDLLILLSCTILVWKAFRPTIRTVWVLSLVLLLLATGMGFFHHFPDYGESGPLPYEWLNGYYPFSLPLILLTLVAHSVHNRKRTKSE